MTVHSASERQVQAAHPAASTWLSANAGSGKTRVLTDRVARLLLGGVEPQHILCLTYTKAAATEMQNRLFRRLGEWAMKPDPELRASLSELGEGARLGSDTLAQARRLFARAIETPGGLRIQTIHSFCASLLRRFPLEAGVSPQFTELDDRTARLLRDEIVEELAESLAPDTIAALARTWTGEDFETLVQQIVSNRAKFSQPLTPENARRLFGLKQGETAETLLADTFLGDEGSWMPAVIGALLARGGNDAKAAAKLAPLDLAAPTLATLSVLEDCMLTGSSAKEPYTAKLSSFPTKDTRKALDSDTLDRLENLMRRVESARTTRCALNAMDRALTLHAFATAFLPVYEQRKADRGWLDFDDLITRASRLLTDPAVAAWVLFRLDGGIDHILVDEAQDTSPDQWRVIESLAAEFTAGSGARDVERTIFVVGDKKQSIYSFQGADVAAFDEKQSAFRSRFAAVNRAFQSLDLEHSFRSSPAILRVVDETFADRFPTALGGASRHIAYWADMPGRVDLWPLVEKASAQEEDDWRNPVDLVTEEHHTARLAAQIAEEIATMIRSGTSIPEKGSSRPVHAGDFLILVQRRSDLFQEIIRACKARGLPIAGADRLKLGAELAVRDITALLSFLATPEDDLSLAAVLRSPLCGWTEAELHTLAQPRKGWLWEELRARSADFPDAHGMLKDLRDQADFLRPYDLIERLLTRHDARRRLLQRLGPEAEDGIDELLSQALAYEKGDVPSLTGFLVWLSSDEVEIKRQTDSEGRRIRVMTVHGAKGLEAPIVILPDTCDTNPRDRDEVVDVDGTPVWRTPADESPANIAAARARRKEREAEERLRLLYVALTRARSWLIVCGAGEAKQDQAWYRLVQQGMAAAGADTLQGGRLRHAFGQWPDPAPRETPVRELPALPAWAVKAADVPPRLSQPLTPSTLGGAKALAGDGLDEESAKARGTALHLLLEHLPATTPTDQPALAEALVPDPTLRAELLPEALAVIAAHPALFAAPALTEVELTADLFGQRLRGTVDRLIILPDRILAIDFKSNRNVPATPEQTPDGILRQMAAYAHALGQIYTDRPVEVAILWTRTATLMPLSRDIVSAALPRTTIP
ncbi:double-strand break repair helicase AddA [Rhodobacteraceae bacterium HSP-20]|uniref:DNA 3'-5' helicase n=1 Tax=Paragemmobacter amnigenus TaxID=2852097 RepID=A0ABS6J2A1_9RHOB|nr:double-strand break repair helicase AddA [Rhodobacter amnigenus]MBU9697883.1 double-strand break repair helicase AddA [Rhodobacter amnigenus]MBV4389110.1 double-strand break repair helicase AddA [Rhodobacter amnigenus]